MSPAAIDIDLVAPQPTLSFGPFSIDPIRLVTGSSLADILTPFMRAPMGRRGTWDVYHLALPPGAGITVPIKYAAIGGSIGFRNLDGVFVVIVPAVVAGPLAAEMAAMIARGDAAGPRFDPDSRGQTAEFAIKVKPGMRFPLTIGTVQIALETPR